MIRIDRDQAARFLGVADFGTMVVRAMWLTAEGLAALAEGRGDDARKWFDDAEVIGKALKVIADNFED